MIKDEKENPMSDERRIINGREARAERCYLFEAELVSGSRRHRAAPGFEGALIYEFSLVEGGLNPCAHGR